MLWDIIEGMSKKPDLEIVRGENINYAFGTSTRRSLPQMLQGLPRDLAGLMGHYTDNAVRRLRTQSRPSPDYPLSTRDVLASIATPERKLRKVFASLQAMGATWTANAIERLQKDPDLRGIWAMILLLLAGFQTVDSLGNTSPPSGPNSTQIA